MKKLSFREVQLEELEILKKIDNFCKEHSIKYSLSYGTLIGAVRHQGFIPWDDDIDIIMLREDYNRFTKLIKEGNVIDEHLKVRFPLDDNYPFPYIKVVNTQTLAKEQGLNEALNDGIWVDIFPIDYLSNDMNENINMANKSAKNRYWLYKLTRNRGYYQGIKKVIMTCFTTFMNMIGFNAHHFVKKNLEFTTRYENTDYAGLVVWCIGPDIIYPVSMFEEFTEVTFEGYTFPALAKYDEFLTQTYGDYMQLPPEEKRVTHGVEAYRLEEDKWN